MKRDYMALYLIVYHSYEFNPSPSLLSFPSFFRSSSLPRFFTFSSSFLYSSLLPYPLNYRINISCRIFLMYASSTQEAEDETHLELKCGSALRKGLFLKKLAGGVIGSLLFPCRTQNHKLFFNTTILDR